MAFPVVVLTTSRNVPAESCDAILINRDIVEQIDPAYPLVVTYGHQTCVITLANSLSTQEAKELLLSRTVDLTTPHAGFNQYQGIVHNPMAEHYHSAAGVATTYISLFHLFCR